jgi:protein ImuB
MSEAIFSATSPWYACLHRAPSLEPSLEQLPSSLRALAEDFSPRYECHHADLVTVDIRGLDRLVGDPRRIGEEIRRSALARGLRLHIGIATTRTTAMVLALAGQGLTVVPRGREAAAIAPMVIGILDKMADQPPGAPGDVKAKHSVSSVIAVVKSWGLRTLGELAALPSSELSARLGQQGLVWQSIARGQDVGPLVPTLAEERFESSIELEWPIEGIEPLSFVLTRLLEPLSTRLERRDRGAAAIHVMLGLVQTPDCQRIGQAGAHPTDPPHPSYLHNYLRRLPDQPLYTRSLQLPSPLRDVRALRTLILLDLESHPVDAPIERVTVTIDPTPGRVLQHALFVRAHPTPEQLSTLIARLNALMGEDRVGRPARVDSYRPGAFTMQPFATEHDRAHQSDPSHLPDLPHLSDQPHVVSALRRCRRPVPARVVMTENRPVAVTTDRRGFAGGRVQACAGPWRSSGEWWLAGEAGLVDRAGRAGETDKHPPARPHQPAQSSWDRDEWDVSLSDGGMYRIFQDRDTDRWFIDAIVD